MKMLILMSHQMTEEQKQDAKKKFGIEKFISLPKSLQRKFSQVPADLDSLKAYSLPFTAWVKRNGEKGDYALIQGEYGLTFILVQKAIEMGLVPVYAVTERICKEEKQEDGSIRAVRVFKHAMFRKYRY